MSTRNPTKAVLTLAVVAMAALVLTAGSASAELLVYEPFAYEATELTGQGGALGTTGTWASNDSTGNVSWALHQEGNLSGVKTSYQYNDANAHTFDGTVANLQTSGGYVGYNQGGNNLNADIGLAYSVTASFTSGSTTWIGYVSVRAWDRNMEQANLVLGTDPAPNGSRGDNYGGIGPDGFSGFGTGGGPTRNNRTSIYPMFYNAGQYCNVMGAIPGNAYNQSAFEVSGDDRMSWERLTPGGDFGPPHIVVMKLEWDADTGGEDIISVARFLEADTLSEAAFDALIAAQPNLSSANWAEANKPNLTQGDLDTITFMGVKYFVDEIRIATTFDEAAPIPEPATMGLLALGGLALLARRRRRS